MLDLVYNAAIKALSDEHDNAAPQKPTRLQRDVLNGSDTRGYSTLADGKYFYHFDAAMTADSQPAQATPHDFHSGAAVVVLADGQAAFDQESSQHSQSMTNTKREIMKSIRLMLDSNVFDELIKAPEIVANLNDLSERGSILIYTTHVQADELYAMPDEKCERREALIAVYTELTKTFVPTTAAIWDVSRWDQSTWGAGQGTLQIGDILRTNVADAEDALIAVTADTHADILVTNDKTLRKRIRERRVRLEVLSLNEFVERIRDLDNK